MQKKRPWLSLIVAAVIGAAGAPASAASLGGASNSAVLGQTLDFAIPVRLDVGEAFGAECVGAEVTAGDRRLPSGQVRTLVEPQGTDGVLVRVITSQVIDEPVLTVQISAGCAARVVRRYVVLADPPLPSAGSAAIATAPAFAAAPPEVENGRTAGAAQAEGAPRAGGDATPVPAAVARTVALREAAAVKRQSEARRTDGRRPAAKREARRAAAAARAQAPRRARLAAAPAPAPAARLQLDFVEPRVAADNAVEQALQAVAQAASAASAAADRIAALERNLDKLRSDAQGSRDAAADLRERLARAEEANPWIWVMVGFAMVLGGLAAWLAARLLTARHERHEAWLAATSTARRAAAAEAAPRQPTSPTPFVSSEMQLPQPAAGSRPRPGPAWPPAAPISEWPSAAVPAAEVHPIPLIEPPAFAPQRPLARMPAAAAENVPTLPLAQPLPGDNDSPRDVTIDELLDLEQQAEFFVVLGQDDAAIELLVEHLRHTGGGSPLPYLKLLEIYRRRGDRSDYERTRARFNHRFNAYAPEWEVDLQSGRTLQDYPGVIPRLQQVWSRPLDSMAELEALLFRKSRGELFELPAYREVLFLYALARDLLDRESADTGKVDFLLPMPDGGPDFSITAPAPYLDLGRDSGFGPLDFEERPTAPVDLDLSHDGDRPPSIFDPLEDPPAQPRRR